MRIVTVDQEQPPGPGRRPDARRAITTAALDLFEQQGYDATTVDAIAERAGLSRRTFFHHFASKDAVVFAAHEELLRAVEDHLGTQTDADPVEAVGGALRLVLAHFLADPDFTLRRYRVTRTTTELREREGAWVRRYQQVFSRYLHGRYSGEPRGALSAEVVAAGMVALHNQVLRHWLVEQGRTDAQAELDDALRWYSRALRQAGRGDAPGRVLVAVVDEDADDRAVLDALRRARGRGQD